MEDFTEDFDLRRTGEIAVGVFVGLAAFKLAVNLVKACFL